MTDTILQGDVRLCLKRLDDESVQCCITSPPYWGLRDYGCAGQIGLEPTPEAYVADLVDVFREVKRVLRDDGVLWLNLGDSYAGSGKGGQSEEKRSENWQPTYANKSNVPVGLKPKDLVGIPWLVAFALRADGWYLRSDIIWCLSGGTWVYAWTQKGPMPMMVRDFARLDPSTVRLWNGEKWTQLLGMSRSHRHGDELELVLRSGERISCTPTHRFPTQRGLLAASEIVVGDVLATCQLPEPEHPKDSVLDVDAAWFAGLYLAEGSMTGDTIQIAGHVREVERWQRVQAIAAKFGGSAAITNKGNVQTIRVYGKILNAILAELVTGRTAHDKGFAPVVWRYSNAFIDAMLDGYLGGDGHWEPENHRWRLGFCRNYNLERDLRAACARLGYTLVLNLASVKYNGRSVPTFHGELRKERSGHRNQHEIGEVVAIRKARCREVYDLGVADEPHVFALASGVLTHNSKPNPMPESVTDRCTKSHEYIFMLTKSERYYYDAEAIKESGTSDIRERTRKVGEGQGTSIGTKGCAGFNGFRNKRDVWTVATQPCSEAHFATFPPKLIEPMILAGSKAGDTILDPFMGSGTTAIQAVRLHRHYLGCELNPEYVKMAERRIADMKGPLFEKEAA